MSPDQIRSLGLYALWAFIGAVVATGLQLAQILSGTDVVLIRPLLATFTTSFFGALATALGASQLTRLGSEQIARQVDALKSAGVPKSQMVVLAEEDAAGALAAPLTPAQRAVIVADLKAELLRDPEGTDPLITQQPHLLPEDGGRR